MAKLFIIAAFLIFCCAALAKGFDKKEFIIDILDKLEACKEEVEAKDSDIEELFKMVPASTVEGKCLRACLMKSFEVMNAEGKLDKNAILGNLEKLEDISEEKMTIINEILDKCDAIEVSEDHCEAAREYGKCFKDEAMAYNINEEFKF